MADRFHGLGFVDPLDGNAAEPHPIDFESGLSDDRSFHVGSFLYRQVG
jgi:hypothetical protein